ncbi:hypothetical protein OXX59_003155 [Metschnikowia pulcherrima]
MPAMIPLSTYNLALQPFTPAPAVQPEYPVAVRITLAAVDLEAVDEKAEPSTVRILKSRREFIDDYSDSDAEESDELDSDNEAEAAAEKSEKKGKKSSKSAQKAAEEAEEDEEESSGDDSDVEDDADIEEFVLCTLSPKVQFQQTLDFTITPEEEVHFVVTGSYPVHLIGNYISHPANDSDSEEDEDYDSDELDDDYYQDAGAEDADGDNLTPDEDELMRIEDLEDESDVERKIEELVEQDASRGKKRAAEEEPKKAKKAKEDKKKVQFTKELEQGPTPSKKDKKAEKAEKAKAEKSEKSEKSEKTEKAEKKFKVSTLLGGVVTEDRKTGSGALAKSGNKVGIRYIGKLKNGKVFDKNTSGKPFVFNLGKGECIKGFDLGVAGMAVGGERRVVIPAKMGYGSQALPGIPANSELTFDIKLVSLK